MPSAQGAVATQDVSLEDAPFQIAPEEDIVMYDESADRSTREKHARSDDVVDDAPPALKRHCAPR